jgi:GNAT superfamily N-acetyltransferase
MPKSKRRRRKNWLLFWRRMLRVGLDGYIRKPELTHNNIAGGVMDDTSQVRISDVTENTIWYVACCAQVDEDHEKEQAAKLHEDWMRKTLTRSGMWAKVALDGDEPVGFLFLVPIERTSWYVDGEGLFSIQCMNVEQEYRGRGIGQELLVAAERNARGHAAGIAVIAYDPSDWFMPASFFQTLGYREVERRGSSVLMFKPFVEGAQPPSFVQRQYRPPRLVPGKVIVEAFWSPQCLTTALDIIHVREVCGEFGDDVILRELNATMPGMRQRYGIPRTLFINGVEKGWGYEVPRAGAFDGAEQTWSHEAPKQWLREQIAAALSESLPSPEIEN